MSIEFIDNIEAVKAALEQGIIAGLEEAAGEIESQTKQNTRVGQPGAPTKNSWKHKVVESEHTAYIGSNEENAIWEEFGTGEYALPEGGGGNKSVWYVPVEKVTGYKKPSYNGKVVIVYGKNGQKFYKTNGKKPSRAFWKAYIANEKKALKLIENAIRRAMNK